MTTPPPGSSDAVADACRRAADLLVSHRWKAWFWADGIGFEGLLDASEITGDEEYAGFVYGFFKAWVARMSARSRFDHTAAGDALVRSYGRTRDSALLEAARDFADYLATFVGSSRVDLQACKLEYSIVSPK